MTAPRILVLPPSPRPIAAAQGLRLHAGLGAYWFFGVFFVVGPWIPMLMAIRGGGWDPAFPAALMFFGAIGCVILFVARRRYQQRTAAFTTGVLCNGIVRSRWKKFVFWKSWRDDVIVVEAMLPDGRVISAELQTSNGGLARALPEGTSVQVLIDPNTRAALFPIESGIVLR